MKKVDIPQHCEAQVAAQLIEETIRESRHQGDTRERLLDKVKRTVSQLQANLSPDKIN